MGQEQINQSDSTNNVDMNFFRNLARILSNSYRNHPFKFTINVGLFILSIAILIIIRTNNGFIPSLFSNETNWLINTYLDFISISYAIGFISYLYWKATPIKRALTVSSSLIFIILVSIIVGLFLIPVYDSLRNIILPNTKLTLGEFGSFFASITGLLAFLAVLYTSDKADKRAKETITLAKEEAESNRDRADKAEENNRMQIEEARNRYREDSERAIFFQLLDLHTKKVDSVIYNFDSEQEYTASQAFEKFTVQANIYLNANIIYNNIKNIENIYIDSDMRNLIMSIYTDKHNETSKSKKFTHIPEGDKLINDVKRSINLEYFTTFTLDNNLSYIAYSLDKKDYALIYQSIKYTADIVYKKYGHILGHYFRNMYYVMDTINNFSDKKNYKELFRAQLSRYELSLGFYNAVSSRSSLKMVKLLEEFDVFKDLYEEDISILKLANEKGMDTNCFIKSILNEYKIDINSQSDK